MNVSLTPELERLVNEKVESGLYQTAGEVAGSSLSHSRRLELATVFQTAVSPKNRCVRSDGVLALSRRH